MKLQRLSRKALLLFSAFTLTTSLPTRAADALASTEPKASAKAPSETPAGLVLASTNDHFFTEIRERPSASVDMGPDESVIARMVAEMLIRQHYLALPFNDDASAKFFDRYIEVLDGLHLHFLQTDVDGFAKEYRTKLDDLTLKSMSSDITPARVIYKRFLERVGQRVAYVQELLQTETFTFTGDDRYDLNRKEAPRPKNLEEARQLWRQHLRYELLQEKLAKSKPEEIAKNITRRYTRLLRTFKDLDGLDVFEIYLSALGHVYDPHTDYMNYRSDDDFNISMGLRLFGIGALLSAEDGYCKIAELKPGPAMKSNKLKAGDRIIAVAQGEAEPVDVVEEPLRKVVQLIRGPKGTEVRLTVIPVDTPTDRRIVSLIRDEIKLEDQAAKARVIDLPIDGGKTQRVGVIDLPAFYSEFERGEGGTSSTADVKKLVRKLVQEKVEGIILDLRRNGGGSLEEAINLTGLFIKEGPVVQVSDTNDRISILKDSDDSVLYDGPLVVMTSRFSASASEILAAALQDYGRALIVGDSSTHGKGTVQSKVKLSALPYLRPYLKSTNSPGALKYTTALFYRVNGSSTQLGGVTPDLVLPSVNNVAELGERYLENVLQWRPIKSASYEKLNWTQPILTELKSRSDKRVASSKDFDYIREDMERYQKNMKDRTLSLNEAQRLKERDDLEERRKAREAELKARPPREETIYEISLNLADQPGLPEPAGKTNQLAAAKPDAKSSAAAEVSASVNPPVKEAASEDGDEEMLTRPTAIDAALQEAKRILADLIALWPPRQAVARN